MTPILKYPGAKWRLADWVISFMPPHESYVEPYFGSGGVFFNKCPTRIETVNDLDGEVVNFFRVCREKPDELARALTLTPWSKQEFESARAAPDVSDVERARRFAVRCWMAFGATTGSTSWRNSTGSKKNGGPDNPKLWSGLPDVVYQAASRLKEAQIENRPALDVIRRFDGSDVLIYADPPYMRNTRTAHRDQYHHEMTDVDHVELLKALCRHSGMVLLSGYDCELYRDMLPDWKMVTTGTTAERGTIRTEHLWINPAAEYTAFGQQKLKI